MLMCADIIEYDPKRLSGSPYTLHVNSIPPVFHKQVEHGNTQPCKQLPQLNCLQGLARMVSGSCCDSQHAWT